MCCLLCVEWEKGKITSREVYRALGEMLSTTEDEEKKRHLLELSDRVLDRDVPNNPPDTTMDQAWQDENDGNP